VREARRVGGGVVIRGETVADVGAIATIVEAAFGQRAEAVLVERIRATDRYRPAYTLVAEVDGTVAGHVMVSDVDLVDGAATRRILSLAPLAVDPSRHGQGIGSALVREVAAIIDADGHPLVILEGSPVYYARFGFEDARPRGIRVHLPHWAPPEAGQVLRLAGYDPDIVGDVAYPPAFAGLDEGSA
jgi:putative acetyltransferase